MLRSSHKQHECSREGTSQEGAANLSLSVTEWRQTAETLSQHLVFTPSWEKKPRCHTPRKEEQREKEMCNHQRPLSGCRTNPGRHRDESKLCLTNTLVSCFVQPSWRVSPNGRYTIITSKTFFFSLASPSSSSSLLPGRRALPLLTCLSHKGLQTTSQYLAFFF